MRLNDAALGALLDKLLRCSEKHMTREYRTTTISENEARFILSKIESAHLLLAACEMAFEQTDKVTRPSDWELLRRAIDAAKDGAP